MRKFYIFLFVLMTGLTASAQWTTNTLANTDASTTNTGDCRTLAISDGRTWLAYFKGVGSPNNYEVRAQLLDKDGYKLLGPEGVLVNNAPHPTFTTVFYSAVDGNNNLIVAFANASTNVIYVNKISPSGAQLWTNSITLRLGLLPVLGVLNNGDIIVSWLSATGNKAPMQKLSGTTGDSLLPTRVYVEPLNATHRTAPGQIIPLSNGDFIQMFHNRASSFGTASTLWAQRYNSNGIAQWPAPVQLSNKGTSYNLEYPPIKKIGDTLFIAYTGATGLRSDGFVQRLNPDGTMPWGINGKDFATDDTWYEYDTKIAIPSSGNFFWAVSRLTNTTQGSRGTYIQKFDKTTGARLLTDNAKAVFPIAPLPYMVPDDIALFNDQQPVLMLERVNTAVVSFIYASKLDNNGNFAWTGDTVVLGNYNAQKLRMTLTRATNNQQVAVWVETKGTVPQPFAQPIRTDGTTGRFYLTVSTQGNVSPIITTNGGTLQMIATVYPSAVTQQVIWSLVPVTTSNATISGTGLITAQLNGNGTVWAKAVSVQDPTIKDSMLVTISGQHVPATGLTVSTLGNVPAAITTATGSLQMLATILPANATNPGVTWSVIPVTGSANISSTGVVTPLNDGTVWVKAVSQDNNALKDSMLVTISGQWGNSRLEGIQIYPNPATSEIHLKYLKNHYKTNLRIIDMSGRVVYWEVLAPNALRREKTINLEKFPAGMYIIRFSG
ncbi:MAG TPA: T9SS type A sorting domain-containing protein, partial [Chitinophagaceae bacterium]|nr:T9SS type A sorting domain-containing protein [Chitinophagaceae bacterium]